MKGIEDSKQYTLRLLEQAIMEAIKGVVSTSMPHPSRKPSMVEINALKAWESNIMMQHSDHLIL